MLSLLLQFHSANQLLSVVSGIKISRNPSIPLAIHLMENDKSWIRKLQRQTCYVKRWQIPAPTSRDRIL